MISLSIFRELFDYHYHARDLVLDACSRLSRSGLTRRLRGPDCSVQDLTAQMVAAEESCLFRCGVVVRSAPAEASGLGTLSQVRDRWRHVESEIRRYLGSISQALLQNPVEWTQPDGTAFSSPRWKVLFDLINQHAHLRGEVCLALWQAGIRPPDLSFLDGRVRS